MLASLISVSRDERRETRAVECAPSGRAIWRGRGQKCWLRSFLCRGTSVERRGLLNARRAAERFGEGDDFGRETVGIVCEDIEFGLRDVVFVEGDEKLGYGLHQGSVGDLEKVSEIRVGVAA